MGASPPLGLDSRRDRTRRSGGGDEGAGAAQAGLAGGRRCAAGERLPGALPPRPGRRTSAVTPGWRRGGPGPLRTAVDEGGPGAGTEGQERRSFRLLTSQ